MANLATLRVNLIAQTADYIKNLDKAQKRIDKYGLDQKKALDVVSNGFKLVGTAAAAAGAGMAALYARQSDAINEMARLSSTLGIATSDLQAYQNAAKQLGIEADVVNDVLEEMNIKIGEAALEGGASADALALLGLSAQELWGMNPADQFELIASKIGELDTQAEKAAASTILLGEAGFKAIALFDSGAIEQSRQDIERFNLELTNIETAQVVAAEQAFARLGNVTDGIGKKLSAALAPLAEFIAEGLIEEWGEGVLDWKKYIDDFAIGVVYVQARWADLRQTVEEAFAQVEVKALKFQRMTNKLLRRHEALAETTAALAKAEQELDGILARPDAGDAVIVRYLRIKQEAEAAAAASDRLVNNANNIKPFTGPDAANDEDTTSEFDRLRQRLIDEEQAIQESWERRRELILEHTAAGEEERYALLTESDAIRNEELNAITEERRLAEIESRRQHDEALIALEAEKWSRLVGVSGSGAAQMLKRIQTFQKLENKTWQDRTRFALGTVGALTQGFADESGRMFEINKAMSIANAIINTAQGVTMALGSAPPPINFANAALVAAAGAVQIATIASSSPGGGGSISSPSGSGGGAGSAPPVEDLPDVEPERTAQNVNIVIEPGIYDSNSVRDLIGAINEELSDGIDLNVRVG